MSREPRARGLYTSHKEQNLGGEEPPTEAHVALQMDDGVFAIPKGGILHFIENPRRADTIQTYILEKVVFENHVLREVRFIAFTKDKKSTRRLRLMASYEGEHISALGESTERAVEKVREAQEEPFVNPLTGKKG